ncbi:MAG: phosphoenolpyruvate--protein phosphotransferase [Hyphomicrobiaceae bacterium]|nr:phosphoenolpyruvate--protein phosphotransferase [Hyphomicrobiaceae bacterium]
MPIRPGEDPHIASAEPALRLILRRLRETMAETDDGQRRLDKIVRLVSGLMVAEVCSIYLKRGDHSLELFATEGLNPGAVHNTFMKRGEGLVGRCAELAVPVNEPDAQSHPAFSYRPETGEEAFHSFLAVPILRNGEVLGVLTVQNKTPRHYSDDDVEALQTTAMVLAEHLVTGAVSGVSPGPAARQIDDVVRGQTIAEGLALGHVVLHAPRIAVTELIATDTAAEGERLEAAIAELKSTLDLLITQGDLARAGEHRDVLEAYRMFANDRGWQRRLAEAVKSGLTAEAAVEQVQNRTRARMLRLQDPFWRERLRDLDDLSDRLLRVLVARKGGAEPEADLPMDAIVVARTMGAADLLDYDRSRLKGLVIEESSSHSHVAIVARALGIAAIGGARGVMERIERGTPIIVDAESGEVYVRPSSQVIAVYADKARFRARRQRQYDALRERPAITRDGQRISLHVNAGLTVDLAHLDEAGADGIGLYRTELQFMIAPSLPRLERQTATYRAVLDAAGDRPVVFRTLDIGGDKVLPYLRSRPEENPALGWRGVRLALDRPALLQTQIRAMLRAADGRPLTVMAPMVSERLEFVALRQLVEGEVERARRRGHSVPSALKIGIMIEVPSLLFALDDLFPLLDFVSIGSNDLLQYLFAADRGNELVSTRFDTLSAPFLRAVRMIIEAGRRHAVPVSLCGEMGGRPLEAAALVGLGLRSLSMAPASIGPVKAMLISLDAARAEAFVLPLLGQGSTVSIREAMTRFAENEGLEL